MSESSLHRLLPVSRVAPMLGMSRPGVIHAIRRGDLHARKIADAYLMTPEAIERYMRIRKRAGRPPVNSSNNAR